MALTREAPDAAPRRTTQSRTERLRAKAQPSDGEYRIGDRLRSNVNPEIVWTVGGMLDGGLTIISPSGQRHDVDLPIIRSRFTNLRIDAESTAAGLWASDEEIAEFEASPAGRALRESECPQREEPAWSEEPSGSDRSEQSDRPSRIVSLTCGVTRKLSRNYNSTEYHCGATVEITDGSDPETVADQTYDMLRQIIRDQFTKGQNTNGSTT